MRRPTITLCMIVKDEEETLAACLASVTSIVDDIVIVDTGSRDATIAIAQKYTDQIYRFAWTDDFAAARNFALNRVRGDWVLWLDGDEEIEMEDANTWKASFAKKSQATDALLVPLKNYYGTAVNEAQMYLYSSFRLLRTAAKFRYKQAIHEHLDLATGEYRLGREPVSGISIRHYGYLDAFVRKRNKSERNLKILQKETTAPNYDPWLDYHLASEHYRRRDYIQAFDSVNKAMQRFLHGGQLPPALAYKLKYEILLVTGSLDNALAGIEQAISLYPDYVDLHYYKGLIQYQTERFDDAIQTFQKCIELGEDHRHLILKGAGSFMAMYMIGMARERLGEGDAATAIYEQLAQTHPEFAPPVERLTTLRSDEGA